MFYKKPTFWFTIAALLVLVITAIFPNMPIDVNTGGRILVLLVSLVLGINIESGTHVFTGRPLQPFWKSRKFQLAAAGIVTSLLFQFYPTLNIDPMIINGLVIFVVARIFGIAIEDNTLSVGYAARPPAAFTKSKR